MSNEVLQRIDGSALRYLAAGERAQPCALVVMLHGYGVDCFDMYAAGATFAEKLPGALLVFPNAPQSIRDSLSVSDIASLERERPGVDWEKHRSWVGDVASHEPNREAAIGALSAAVSFPVRALSRFTDLLLARYSLTNSALAFYGFSQGGMVALYLGIARDETCAAVVCHSGHFPGALDVHSRPRTLVIMGEGELDPLQRMSQIYPITIHELKSLDIAVSEHACKGLVHGINAELIETCCNYLRSNIEHIGQ